MQPTIDIVVLHLGCTRDRAAPQMASLSGAIATLDAFKKSAPAIARALCFGQSLMKREMVANDQEGTEVAQGSKPHILE